MSATNDQSPPRLSPGRAVLGLSVAALVTVAIVLLVGRFAGFADLSETLRGGDPGWLLVCAAGQVAVFGGYAGAMRRALAFEGGPRVPAGLSLRLALTSFALTQVVAAGGVAGLAVMYWALRRMGFTRRDSAVRLIALSTAVYLVFGLVAWAAALLGLLAGVAPPSLTLPWLFGIPLVLLAATWFTAPGRVDRWTAPSGGRLRQGLGVGVAAAAWVRRAQRSSDGRPVLVWSACYWLGDVASLWGALRAFGEAPGIVPLTLVYATGYLAQSIPVPFLATGGLDAATTLLLTVVGVPLEVALVGVVAHRVFAFWLPLVPGTILTVLLPRTGHALETLQPPSDERPAHLGGPATA
jgi:uncharacterized membrane protein YbhN (UPF0104 family)